jgi:probable DNA metabolism protein
MTFEYDGTFDGLLSAIFASYSGKGFPDRIIPSQPGCQRSLFQNTRILTDRVKAERVYKAIMTRISGRALKNVYYAFLSEKNGIERHILSYLHLGWKLGKQVDSVLSNPSVLAVFQSARRVSRERHLFLGLVRFARINEVYYSRIKPDHHILPLLGPHFQKRMPGHSWVIHDIRRQQAIIYKEHHWFLCDMEDLDAPVDPDEEERAYQTLWKKYFNHIWIRNRTNPKLQRQHMPLKYWNEIVEMQ